MKQNKPCLIWGTPANMSNTDGRMGFTVDSPRTEGKYFIPNSNLHGEPNNVKIEGKSNNVKRKVYPSIDNRTKTRLTSTLIEERQSGTEWPEISIETIDEAEQRSNLPIYERVDRLLECLKRKSKYIGEQIQHSELDSDELLCWSESINLRELEFLNSYLIERGWILGDHNYLTVTVKGYVHLEKTKN